MYLGEQETENLEDMPEIYFIIRKRPNPRGIFERTLAKIT